MRKNIEIQWFPSFKYELWWRRIVFYARSEISYMYIVTLPLLLLFVNTLSNFIYIICTLQEFSSDVQNSIISLSAFRFQLSTMLFLLRKFCNLYFLVCMLNKVSFERMTTFTKKYGFSLILNLCDDNPTYHMCHCVTMLSLVFMESLQIE